MSQKPAFPMTFVNPTQYNLMGPDGNVVPPLGMVSTPGMTQRAYAAIALKVPASGEAWLDAMIRESQREDAARRAAHGYIASFAGLEHSPTPDAAAAYGRKVADELYPTESPDHDEH